VNHVGGEEWQGSASNSGDNGSGGGEAEAQPMEQYLRPPMQGNKNNL